VKRCTRSAVIVPSLGPRGEPELAFAGWVTQAAGEKLLATAGRTVDELLKASDSRDFKPIPLGIRIRGRINSKIRDISTLNVAAVVPGVVPAHSALQLREFLDRLADQVGVGQARDVGGRVLVQGEVLQRRPVCLASKALAPQLVVEVLGHERSKGCHHPQPGVEDIDERLLPWLPGPADVVPEVVPHVKEGGGRGSPNLHLLHRLSYCPNPPVD
jgi:hypothetical protein